MPDNFMLWRLRWVIPVTRELTYADTEPGTPELARGQAGLSGWNKSYGR